MKKPITASSWLVLLSCLLSVKAGAVDTDLARYATAKENQVREYAKTLDEKVPAIVWRYFDAVRVDDWETATNLATRIEQASGRYSDASTDPAMSPALRTVIWPPISEMIGTYEQFHKWDNHCLHRFGREIIGSIPGDSIYFGGTDPGRFVISALSASLGPEAQFCVLTQNQLADQTYLEYLRKLYGPKLYMPTSEDSQAVFEEYTKDAQERMKNGELKPGEDVRVVEGRIQVSGQVAVMAINGLLARMIVEKNPGHEVFVEQSFPLNWMYPFLTSHGLIFQVHGSPLTELSAGEVSQDQSYWRELTGDLIGDWLHDQTRLKEICDFVDKVYLDKDLAGFHGDPGFAKNLEAQKEFSRLRNAQAEMYVWRAGQAATMDVKIRMQNAADLAFRQAYAFCPRSPEVLLPFTQFLLGINRPDDAFLLVKTSLRLDPDNPMLHDLMEAVMKAR